MTERASLRNLPNRKKLINKPHKEKKTSEKVKRINKSRVRRRISVGEKGKSQSFKREKSNKGNKENFCTYTFHHIAVMLL